MRFLLSLLLVFAVTCVFFHYDVFTDGSLSDTGHKSLTELEADYKNSEKEQERFQKRIDSDVSERNRYIGLANDLKVRGGSSLGSLQTTMISSLSSATKTTLANTVGLTLRAFLSAYGSSSFAGAIESAVSTARSHHGSAESAYNNTNRTDDDDTYMEGYDRFDTANSAIEAWYENGLAADHRNVHVSPGEYWNATDPPNGPTYIKWPGFECPGPCTQEWTTVDAAIDAHHEKCGLPETEPVSRLLDFASQQTILAARSVSDGCGVEWYSCDSNHSSNEAYHRKRTCAKGVWRTRYTDYTNGRERYRAYTCGKPFRHCMPHTNYHKSSTFKDTHSEADDTGSSPPTASTPPPSENPVVSPPPPPTPTPSPTYHACSVHETSVSGDHSLQASCSSTDSNGNYCTVTNFYACDSHTHSYPTPPPTPTPTPPPEPTPTPPPSSLTTVVCGANGWTGCTIQSSDGNACRVDPCDSGCGSYYWSCSTSGVSWHKTSRTCKRTNCGASYTNCTRGDGMCSGGQYTWHKK